MLANYLAKVITNIRFREVYCAIANDTEGERVQVEVKAQEKVEDEIQEQAEVQAQEKVEDEIQEQVEAQAQEKVEDEVHEQAEVQAQEKVEDEIQEQVEVQAQEKVEHIIQEQVEVQAQEKVEHITQEQVEVQAQEQVENITQEQAEVQAQEQVEHIIPEQVEVQAQEQVENITQEQVEVQAQEKFEHITQEQVEVQAQEQVEHITQEQVEVQAQEQVEHIIPEQAEVEDILDINSIVNNEENEMKEVESESSTTEVKVEVKSGNDLEKEIFENPVEDKEFLSFSDEEDDIQEARDDLNIVALHEDSTDVESKDLLGDVNKSKDKCTDSCNSVSVEHLELYVDDAGNVVRIETQPDEQLGTKPNEANTINTVNDSNEILEDSSTDELPQLSTEEIPSDEDIARKNIDDNLIREEQKVVEVIEVESELKDNTVEIPEKMAADLNVGDNVIAEKLSSLKNEDGESSKDLISFESDSLDEPSEKTEASSDDIVIEYIDEKGSDKPLENPCEVVPENNNDQPLNVSDKEDADSSDKINEEVTSDAIKNASDVVEVKSYETVEGLKDADAEYKKEEDLDEINIRTENNEDDGDVDFSKFFDNETNELVKPLLDDNSAESTDEENKEILENEAACISSPTMKKIIVSAEGICQQMNDLNRQIEDTSIVLHVSSKHFKIDLHEERIKSIVIVIFKENRSVNAMYSGYCTDKDTFITNFVKFPINIHESVEYTTKEAMNKDDNVTGKLLIHTDSVDSSSGKNEKYYILTPIKFNYGLIDDISNMAYNEMLEKILKASRKKFH